MFEWKVQIKVNRFYEFGWVLTFYVLCQYLKIFVLLVEQVRISYLPPFSKTCTIFKFADCIFFYPVMTKMLKFAMYFKIAKGKKKIYICNNRLLRTF